jgi:uncharacterized protein YbaA (DUF1428 family)
MTYIDGYVIPVRAENKEAYRKVATAAGALYKEFGALRVVENWGDDVPDGKITDFKGAVKAEPGEVIVFSWIEWPSKELRDSGQAKMMSDPRVSAMDMPFDGKRMIYGGFTPLLDV